MSFLNYCSFRYGETGAFVNALIVFALVTFLLPGRGLAAERIKILALGDSLTAGYGLLQADAFPNRLEQALIKDGIAVKVVNAGVSGDTSAGGLSRLNWALSDKPEAVIIELGANDGLRGLEPTETFKNLDAILRILQKRKLAVLLQKAVLR